MIKKIVGVLLVLCTLLTAVQFIGSASNVDENGVLTLDSTTSDSGDGWSWDGKVLTLAQGEVKAINFGENIADAKIVLTENVLLNGNEIELNPTISFSSEGTLEIDAKDYTLTLSNNGDDAIDATGNVIISGGTIVAENNAAYGYDIYVRTGNLTVSNAKLYCNFTGLRVINYANSNDKWVGGNIYITNSVVSVNNNRDMDGISAEKTMEVTSSIINSTANRCAVLANDLVFVDSIVTAKGNTGCMRATNTVTIDNSNITADGVEETISACYYVGTNKADLSKFTVTNADIVTPEGSTIAQGVSVPSGQTDSVAYIVGIKDANGSFA